jgi:hypothetical protein
MMQDIGDEMGGSVDTSVGRAWQAGDIGDDVAVDTTKIGDAVVCHVALQGFLSQLQSALCGRRWAVGRIGVDIDG